MAKPDAYDVIVEYLKEIPILSWACERAGISRQAVYEMMDRDEEIRAKIDIARAIGEEKQIKQVSPERILAWARPDRYTNTQKHEISGVDGGPLMVSAALAEPGVVSGDSDGD